MTKKRVHFNLISSRLPSTAAAEELIAKQIEARKEILNGIVVDFRIDEQGAITLRETYQKSKMYYIDAFWKRVLGYVFQEIFLLSSSEENGKDSFRADMSLFPNLRNALVAAEQAIDKMTEQEHNEYYQNIVLSLVWQQQKGDDKNYYHRIDTNPPWRLVDAAKKLYRVEYREPADKDKISKTAKKDILNYLNGRIISSGAMTNELSLSVKPLLEKVRNLSDMQEIYNAIIWKEEDLRK